MKIFSKGLALLLAVCLATDAVPAMSAEFPRSLLIRRGVIVESSDVKPFYTQALGNRPMGAQFLRASGIVIRAAIIIMLVTAWASQTNMAQTRSPGAPTPAKKSAPAKPVRALTLFEQNKTALDKAGFVALSNGYYLKGASWLIKLENNGELSKALFGLWYGFTPDTLKAINYAIVPDWAIAPGETRKKFLQLIDANGRVLYRNDEGSGGATGLNGPLFTEEEMKTGTPLQARLRNLGAVEESPGSGLYVLKDGQRDIFFLYRNERIEFIGTKSRTININPRTKLLGIITVKEEHLSSTDVFDALQFEGPELRYSLGSWGGFPQDSVVEELTPFDGVQKPVPFSEIASDYDILYRKNQTRKIPFTAEDPSGFHIGGVNSNDVIRNLPSLTGVPLPELDRRMRPQENGSWWKGLLVHMVEWNTAVAAAHVRHDQLAAPMFHPIYFFTSFREAAVKFVFTFKGQKLQVTHAGIMGGYARRVFEDNVPNNGMDYYATNLTTGETETYPDLLPYWIARYGVYYSAENNRVPHPPAKLLRFFGFRPTTPPHRPASRPAGRPLAKAA